MTLRTNSDYACGSERRCNWDKVFSVRW